MSSWRRGKNDVWRERIVNMMEFSVVIPVYNEEENLAVLHERLHRVFDDIPHPYEIIYVNDGSTDASLEVLKNLQAHYPSIRVVSLESNRGQSEGLHAGFRVAKGKWIITLDADLQNPPEEILTLLAHRDSVDFITGVRTHRKDTAMRRASSGIARSFRHLILNDVTQDTGCSLRMFRREVVEHLPYFRNFHRFFTFLAREAGFKVKELPVKHDPRKFGESKYGILKRAREGLFDLIGVFWLKARLIRYKAGREY